MSEFFRQKVNKGSKYLVVLYIHLITSNDDMFYYQQDVSAPSLLSLFLHHKPRSFSQSPLFQTAVREAFAQEDVGSNILCMTEMYSYSLYISLQGLSLLECKQIILTLLNENTENSAEKRKISSQFLVVAV